MKVWELISKRYPDTRGQDRKAIRDRMIKKGSSPCSINEERMVLPHSVMDELCKSSDNCLQCLDKFLDMEAVENELRPCPFCGSESLIIDSCKELEECALFECCGESGFYSVVCNIHNGGCGASSGYSQDYYKLLEKWNRRTGPGL